MAKKINITWTQPTIGQPVDDYTIEYGVSGQALTQVNTGDSSTSYEIVDLVDNEIYQLRIAGTNATGQGDFTPIIYHYASQYPSAPLALSSGQPVSSGDLLLTWNAPEFSETNINNYSVSYTPDGDNTANIITTNTSYNITNLDCSKNVNVSIKASNTSGEGLEVVADFTPFCGTPVVPTSIGTVAVAGPTSPTEGDVSVYSVTNDGDAGNLSYAWSIVGGTGSSTTETCPVTWGPDGAGQVTCTITSGDDAPTDSPASDSLSVTINAAPTTPPPTTPAPSAFNITLEDDGTSGFDLQADISMDDLPAGATGYKIAFEGTLGEGTGTPFTGALLYIQNPIAGPIYSTNDGPPSTGGTATDTFKAFWRSGTIPPTSGYNRDSVFITTQAGSEFDGTVTIQPIDASNNPVGPISNTINVFIYEDG